MLAQNGGGRLVQRDQGQQQMLAADEAMAELARLRLGLDDDLAGACR